NSGQNKTDSEASKSKVKSPQDFIPEFLRNQSSQQKYLELLLYRAEEILAKPITNNSKVVNRYDLQNATLRNVLFNANAELSMGNFTVDETSSVHPESIEDLKRFLETATSSLQDSLNRSISQLHNLPVNAKSYSAEIVNFETVDNQVKYCIQFKD